jgi:GT2 family glycosyltransferase
MKYSIIIPVFNNEKMTKECLASIEKYDGYSDMFYYCENPEETEIRTLKLE